MQAAWRQGRVNAALPVARKQGRQNAVSPGMTRSVPFPFAIGRVAILPGPVGLDSPQAQPAGFILPNSEGIGYGAASPAPGAPRLRPGGEWMGSARPAPLGMAKSQDAAQNAGAKAAGPAARNRKR